MKISIVTPHSVYNYGAVLQAYGLYTYLEKNGYEVYAQFEDCPPGTIEYFLKKKLK